MDYYERLIDHVKGDADAMDRVAREILSELRRCVEMYESPKKIHINTEAEVE